MDRNSILGKRRRPEKSYTENDDESGNDVQEVKEDKRRASDDHEKESEHKKKKLVQKGEFDCPRIKETKSKLPDALQGTFNQKAHEKYNSIFEKVFGKKS